MRVPGVLFSMVAMIFFGGCGKDNSTSVQQGNMSHPSAKLTVSGIKAGGTCELPGCRPGFGDNKIVSIPKPEPEPESTLLPTEGTIVLEDDFESYVVGGNISSGGWTVHAPGRSARITTETQSEGEQSYLLEGGANSARVELFPIGFSSRMIIEVSIMAPEHPTGGLVGFITFTPHTRWAGISFGQERADSNMIGWYAGRSRGNIMEYEPGRWYDLIISVDMEAGRVNVYIDGELVVDETIELEEIEFEFIELTSDNDLSSNVFFVDNLRVIRPE